MERRESLVTFRKAGGNAGKTSLKAGINLPKPWLDKMGITADERTLLLTFDGGKITIEKADIEILKSKDNFKLIKIKDGLYEIKDGKKLVLSMEGAYSKEELEKQFNDVGKGYCII